MITGACLMIYLTEQSPVCQTGKLEFERRKLMYPLLSVFIISIGALLLAFANKIAKKQQCYSNQLKWLVVF